MDGRICQKLLAICLCLFLGSSLVVGESFGDLIDQALSETDNIEKQNSDLKKLSQSLQNDLNEEKKLSNTLKISLQQQTQAFQNLETSYSLSKTLNWILVGVVTGETIWIILKK